ncbi:MULTISPECIES: hypothetical protein [Nosocomiicoccus]|uniref:Uncharacterized protein n=1 Tax=Nosocomiicoccus massiliensis TaxID=1232430 RepID=A0AAF0YHG9_9STAP|nr:MULTISPECIES: hypothetical protein [Nosocomiicoccus]MDK6863482.1 hypothetical protein [Nosocomiicoccus ampullae]OFO52405.1 hypothetical protein HMPREF3029_06215 [Nosocomiicoccus sp. HMSC059G07]WOS95520.1 hypothetical protein CJ229_005305 [Nosocomiicoccus massiliensis]
MNKTRIFYALRVMLIAFLVFNTINNLVESTSGSISSILMYSIMCAVLVVAVSLLLLGKPDEFK